MLHQRKSCWHPSLINTSCAPTSGLTGSSIPTTQIAVRSLRMLFSSSQLGSGSLGKSRYATQMVLRPSHAIGSITFLTISSLSRGRKTLGSPTSFKMWLHLWNTTQIFEIVAKPLTIWCNNFITLYWAKLQNASWLWCRKLSIYCCNFVNLGRLNKLLTLIQLIHNKIITVLLT